MWPSSRDTEHVGSLILLACLRSLQQQTPLQVAYTVGLSEKPPAAPLQVAYTVGLSEKPPAADMIIRLGRLTPGYFRLLQRQVSGEVQMQPQNSLVDPIAMTMATVGIGVSFYSARQMAERVHLKQPGA